MTVVSQEIEIAYEFAKKNRKKRLDKGLVFDNMIINVPEW